MPAAPPGTVIMTVPMSDGLSVVATITFNPADGSFPTNPVIHAVNGSTVDAHFTYTRPSGASATATLKAGNTANISRAQLSAIGITSIDLLIAELDGA